MIKGWNRIEILLVDENNSDYEVFDQVSKQIDELSITITWVKSYSDGEEAITKRAFDIVFIDNDLSDRQGIELLSSVNSCNPRPPAVLLTKKDQPELDSKALEAGATDYLAKDYLNRPILFRTIRHAIQRHQQRLKYEYQQKKFQGFFEQSMDGVFIVDEAWIVQDMNDVLRGLLDIPKTKDVTNLKSLIIPKSEWPRFTSLLTENNEITNYPIQLEGKQESLNILVSCRAIFNSDLKLAGYQGVVRDVTAFKQAEYEIAQAEQFNLTGRMARIIAHEVRNPLSNISLASDYLKESNGKDDETFDTYIDIIIRNATRINDLIDGLLNSTKSSEIIKTEFRINKLIDAAIKICDDRLRLKSTKVHVSFENEKESIHGDFSKLTIALVNLITNAIEAMENTPEPRLIIHCSSDDKHIFISVEDNGIGMTQETKNSLFRPFYTQRHGGMGLGLSAVKHLLSQHDGAIHFESKYEVGTTFVLSIPRKSLITEA